MVEKKIPLGNPNSTCGLHTTRIQNPDGTLSLTLECSARDKNPKTCPHAATLPTTTTIDPRFISEQIKFKMAEDKAQALHDTCLGPIDPHQSN